MRRKLAEDEGKEKLPVLKCNDHLKRWTLSIWHFYNSNRPRLDSAKGFEIHVPEFNIWVQEGCECGVENASQWEIS